MSQPQSSRRGQLARVALCPTGCKTTAGRLFDVGKGGCDECYRFASQSVTQQIVTSDRLIKAENQMLRDAASKAIPLPTSPNKEATRVALAAQSIHVSMQHQHIQASRVIFVKPKPQKQKQKIQKKKKVQKGGSPSNTGGRGSPVIVDKEDNVPSLDVAALS